MSHRGWIGVDLDGTLAEYHGWKGEDHIGKPIPEMVEKIKKALEGGAWIKIFTARVYSDGTAQREKEVATLKLNIQAYCHKIFGQFFEVTNVKDYQCRRVVANTGRFCCE